MVTVWPVSSGTVGYSRATARRPFRLVVLKPFLKQLRVIEAAIGFDNAENLANQCLRAHVVSSARTIAGTQESIAWCMP